MDNESRMLTSDNAGQRNPSILTKSFGLLRLIVIIIHNLYQIPSYLFLTWFILIPVYVYNSQLYWYIENHLYNWLLYTVSSWSWGASIRVTELNQDISKLSATAEPFAELRKEVRVGGSGSGSSTASEINGNLSGSNESNHVQPQINSSTTTLNHTHIHHYNHHHHQNNHHHHSNHHTSAADELLSSANGGEKDLTTTSLISSSSSSSSSTGTTTPLMTTNNGGTTACMKNKPTKVLVLSNHQSTADVPLMMASFASHPKLVLMWIMDSQFKYTNFGVVSLTHGDYFIKAKDYIKSELTKYCLSQKRTNCIVLFPEGGFRYKRKESSNHYAVKNGLQKLEMVTWPRVGAFNDLILDTSNLTHIVDLAIMYPELENPPSILDIAFGICPQDVYFYYRIYDLSKMSCVVNESWLNQIWLEKDSIMKRFYESKEDFLKETHFVKTVELSWLKILAIHLFYLATFVCFLRLFKVFLTLIY